MGHLEHRGKLGKQYIPIHTVHIRTYRKEPKAFQHIPAISSLKHAANMLKLFGFRVQGAQDGRRMAGSICQPCCPRQHCWWRRWSPETSKKNQTCVQMRWDVFRCLMCSVQTSYHVCQHAKSGYLIVTSKWDPRAWGIRQNATTSHVNLHKECLTSWPDKWQIHWRHASHLKHYQSPAFGTLDNVITSLQSA